ncbi:MAG TPA: hypothetical protein VGN72_10950 [Tepidisphaeraceae bacterium]|nr:hypothetical protein [Tepidisphaeraceae bacterium]
MRYVQLFVVLLVPIETTLAAAELPQALVKATQARDQELESARVDYVKRQLAAHDVFIMAAAEVRRQMIVAGNLEGANAADQAAKVAKEQTDALRKSLQKSVIESVAAIAVEGAGFKLAPFTNNSKAFSNRNYVWSDIPAAFEGWSYTQTAGGQPASIKITVKQAGDVYIAIGSGAKIPELKGWKPIRGGRFGYNDGKGSTLSIFSREAKAEDVLEIPQTAVAGWAGCAVLVPPPAQDAGK